MVKSVNRGIAGPDAVAGAGGDAVGGGQGPDPGGAAAGGPAARVPLRQLMDDRLPARCWNARATRRAGCG
jgi:hypothetical protein